VCAAPGVPSLGPGPTRISRAGYVYTLWCMYTFLWCMYIHSLIYVFRTVFVSQFSFLFLTFFF
jgi:hypothetical protein